MSYSHQEIDSKWQKKWADAKCFEIATPDPTRPKYYALDMFPYPSGSGLHVGHLASYTPTDVIARFKRARGFEVLHPFGYDAFGLPAEQFAIQTGVHPAITTGQAIENFRRQLQSFGLSFDWSREISTADPAYYKWTQYFFIQLWKKGLAYQKEAPVNWCPALKTVLANEEVVDGKSERGGHPVLRLPMKQWMLKITDYAERLLQGLDTIDWPERTKEGQRHWIGKSEGAVIEFSLAADKSSLGNKTISVFTTRPDTIFGATFLVLAPEHPLVREITSAAQNAVVEDYIARTSAKSEIDRKANTEKTGVFTGGYALHPFTHKQIPLWIADYVLTDYGTGAIMAVPAHDERDFEFAQKFFLPITRVVDGGDLPFAGEGFSVNSEFLNGLPKREAIQKAISEIEKTQVGIRKVQYKLRDWLFSRQRYWGEPFPMVKMSDGTLKAVPDDELPVVLPQVADYEPTDAGEAPLARVKDWVDYKGLGTRETDTMPGSAGSSWYFLRYVDPHNDQAPFSFDKQKYWMPVDLYIGGAEHTVGHLLYSRFWNLVFFDLGLVSHPEPFQKLFHQGLVLGADGEKMSKSRGNVVNPDEVRERYGADAVRGYVCFMGPTDKDKPWATNGIDGVRRFLDRIYRLVCDESGGTHFSEDPLPEKLERLLHKTIQKVTADIESLNLNTAISQMMIMVNELYRENCKSSRALKPLAQLLMPFAPHFAEELWQKLGGVNFVSLAPWPNFDPKLTQEDVQIIGVQVNGKHRGEISVTAETSEAEAVQQAKEVGTIFNAVGTAPIKKVIYKPGKILNLIVG